MGINDGAKADVCEANRTHLERAYRTHLTLNSIYHSEIIFESYVYEYDAELFRLVVNIDTQMEGDCVVYVLKRMILRKMRVQGCRFSK